MQKSKLILTEAMPSSSALNDTMGLSPPYVRVGHKVYWVEHGVIG